MVQAHLALRMASSKSGAALSAAATPSMPVGSSWSSPSRSNPHTTMMFGPSNLQDAFFGPVS